MKLSTLCYIQRDNQTLMLHRIKKENDMHAGKWNGLGGKFEEGETPEECAIREIEEESGLIAKDITLKGFLTFPDFSRWETWHVWLYLVTDSLGKLIESNEGELAWIDNEKIYDLNLWEGDKIFMKCLNQEGFFSGKFVYKNKELQEYTFERIL